MNDRFVLKEFVIVTLITSVWIHIAEIVRALVVVYPQMDDFFAGKMDINGLDELTLGIALIWGLWDMLLAITLVYMFWLCSQVYGNNRQSIIISGAMTTVATLVVFWVATVNIGLGEWSTAFTVFAMGLVEFLIAAFIASKLFARNGELARS